MNIPSSSLTTFWKKVKSLVSKPATGMCAITGQITSEATNSLTLATNRTGTVIMNVCGDFNPLTPNSDKPETDWIHVRLYIDGNEVARTISQGNYIGVNQPFSLSYVATGLGTTTHTFSFNITPYDKVDFSEHGFNYAKLTVYEI